MEAELRTLQAGSPMHWTFTYPAQESLLLLLANRPPNAQASLLALSLLTGQVAVIPREPVDVRSASHDGRSELVEQWG